MTAIEQFSSFVPRDYDIFIGLDVDKKKMAITCTDHGTMRRSLSMPYRVSY